MGGRPEQNMANLTSQVAKNPDRSLLPFPGNSSALPVSKVAHAVGGFILLGIVLVCAQPIASASDRWQWVDPLPQGHNLIAAASGDGVIVAVGERGTVLRSRNGVDWQISAIGADYTLWDVVWGDGQFVAVGGEWGQEAFSHGNSVVLSSTDGRLWTERHRTDGVTLRSVVWSGEWYVSLGFGSVGLTSDDGVSWNEHNLEEDMSDTVDVAWTGLEYVAVGDSHVSGDRVSSYVSEDGISWERFSMGGGLYPFRGEIVWTGNRFVAAICNVYVSDNGRIWHEVDEGSWECPEAVVSANGTLVAISSGGDGDVLMSPDGYVWSSLTIEGSPDLAGLAWTGDRFLAVGWNGTIVSSWDGISWRWLSSRSPVVGYGDINDMVEGNGTFVGVGEGSKVITSHNGADWFRSTEPEDGKYLSVVWTGTGFWAVGGHRIIASTDGVSWTDVLFDYDVRLFDIAWNGSLMVAVGEKGPAFGRLPTVATSTDGYEWSFQTIDTLAHVIGWSGSHFVAMARDSGEYLTSTDAITWEKHTLDEAFEDEAFEIRDMTSNGNRLVAVGRDHERDIPLVLSSIGGFIWNVEDLPYVGRLSLRDVTWTGRHFVSVGGGTAVLISTDGLTWRSDDTRTGVYPTSIVGDHRALFAVGSGSIIKRNMTERRYRGPSQRIPSSRGEFGSKAIDSWQRD